MSVFDVAVVGAGPAGAFAAYKLARQGHSVCLFEKSLLPHAKPCGGGLTLKALSLLDFPIDDLVKAKVDQVYLTHHRSVYGVRKADRTPYLVSTKRAPVWMVERSQFDQRIAQQAQKAGATLFQGEAVTSIETQDGSVRVRTPENTYDAKVLVGADGDKGKVARWLGLAPQAGQPYMLAIELNARIISYPFGDSALLDFGVPDGYGWVFPKGEYSNVGIATFNRNCFNNLESLLERFIDGQGLNLSDRSQLQGQRIPTGGARRLLNTRNALLVGDAAWLAEPAFGEGIPFALKSGDIAAHVIHQYLTGVIPDLDSYTATVHRTLVEEQRSMKIIRFWLYNFPSISMRLFSLSASLRRAAENVIGGQRSRTGVWQRAYES